MLIKMDKKIVFGIVVFLLFAGIAGAEYEKQLEAKLRQADADERAGNYDVAADAYGGAASAAASDDNFDKAIEYELKSIEMNNKTKRISFALSYGLIADYYKRKAKLDGVDYTDKIRENCEIEERLLLEEIDAELEVQSKATKPSYTRIFSDYDSIVTCYRLISGFNYNEKTCKYCELASRYGSVDCNNLYKCGKTTQTTAAPSGSETFGSSAGDLPLILIGIVILVLILVGGFSLMNGKKK